MEKGHNAGADEKLRVPKTFLGLIYISGIYICYLVYGILQERIMRTPFGEDKEKFTFTLFLLFCQCLASALSSVYGASKTPNQTPIYKYGIFATTYLAAMYFSNVALAYIDYPTQVLGKSCKPIPVMIISTLMGRRYPWYKWLLVLMIVGGISMFFFKPSDGGQGNSTIGIVCLLLSLACDGFTGPFQDRVFKMYKPSTNHMIVYSNLFAVGYCLFGLVLTPEGYEAIAFCQRHPEIINDIFLFSVCGAAGQQFIYLTIQTFNSLVCSIATTTRKFFTILISVLWFGNALLPHQWVGVSLVFIGLGIDSFGSHLDEFVNKLLGKPTPAKGEKFDKPV